MFNYIVCGAVGFVIGEFATLLIMALCSMASKEDDREGR